MYKHFFHVQLEVSILHECMGNEEWILVFHILDCLDLSLMFHPTINVKNPLETSQVQT